MAGAGARARTAAREARVRGQPGTCIVTAGETRAWNDGPSEGSFEALIVTAGETPSTRGLYRHRLQHCTELQPHTTAAVHSTAGETIIWRKNSQFGMRGT